MSIKSKFHIRCSTFLIGQLILPIIFLCSANAQVYKQIPFFRLGSIDTIIAQGRLADSKRNWRKNSEMSGFQKNPFIILVNHWNNIDTIHTVWASNLKLHKVETIKLNHLDTFFAAETLNLDAEFQLNSDHKKWLEKKIWVAGGHIFIFGSSLALLHSTWYKDFPKSPFHSFNDIGEWNQVDKIGHSWSAFQLSRASFALWQGAGFPNKKAIWLGALSGFAYQTTIEFMDAYSVGWGWSWGDIGANIIGSAGFLAQQYTWNDQRIAFKFGFHRIRYPSVNREHRANELFGNTLAERGLKDYNGQTYWLSANMKSFFPKSNLPNWFNVALGYGADGMLGGFRNSWINADGTSSNAFQLKRVRQWYLAPDLDFSKIPTRNKLLKALLFGLNAIKIPCPTLEWSNGGFKVRAFYM